MFSWPKDSTNSLSYHSVAEAYVLRDVFDPVASPTHRGADERARIVLDPPPTDVDLPRPEKPDHRTARDSEHLGDLRCSDPTLVERLAPQRWDLVGAWSTPWEAETHCVLACAGVAAAQSGSDLLHRQALLPERSELLEIDHYSSVPVTTICACGISDDIRLLTSGSRNFCTMTTPDSCLMNDASLPFAAERIASRRRKAAWAS